MIKFISVITKMDETGNVKPLKILWEDGRIFEIDKILDVRKKASTKGGGAGIRYLVKINGHEKYLFLNDYKWFIEVD